MVRIEETVKKYVGIPFEWMGRTFEGCDCIGVAYLWHLVENGNQLPLSDLKGKQYSGNYEDRPDDRMLEGLLQWGSIRYSPQLGDVVLFGQPYVVHCGIYLWNGKWISQTRSEGKSVIDDMNGWFDSYRGAIRVKGGDKHGRLKTSV